MGVWRSRGFLTFLVSIQAVGLSGCATSANSVSYLDHQLSPLADTAAVNTWPLGMSEPDRPYVIVGEVFVQRASTTVFGRINRQNLLNDLRGEARRMGADGVLALMSGNSGVTGRQVDQAWYWGIAVRFLDTWENEAETQRRRDEMIREARSRFGGKAS